MLKWTEQCIDSSTEPECLQLTNKINLEKMVEINQQMAYCLFSWDRRKYFNFRDTAHITTNHRERCYFTIGPLESAVCTINNWLYLS